MTLARSTAAAAAAGIFVIAGVGSPAHAVAPEAQNPGTVTADTGVAKIQNSASPAPAMQTPQQQPSTALAQARAHMSAAEYEEAIAILEPVVEGTRFDPNLLQETYLMLVEAHVYAGNRSPAGTEQQRSYEKARELIRECLGVRELRRTRPEPPDRYPAEMLKFFDEVRGEIFGSFEITQLEPSDAEVTFDGEALAAGADGIWRAVDVPIGARLLVIRHSDYEVFTEDIVIEPAKLVSRPYALRRKKGFGWYATFVAAPLAAVVGLAVGVVASVGEETPVQVPVALEPPLPEPPSPPSP
jgi:hypothetical protein